MPPLPHIDYWECYAYQPFRVLDTVSWDLSHLRQMICLDQTWKIALLHESKTSSKVLFMVLAPTDPLHNFSVHHNVLPHICSPTVTIFVWRSVIFLYTTRKALTFPCLLTEMIVLPILIHKSTCMSLNFWIMCHESQIVSYKRVVSSNENDLVHFKIYSVQHATKNNLLTALCVFPKIN